jgi:hypothetical protein
MGFKDIPIRLGDMMPSFPAVDRSEFEWAMDEGIVMCQVNPFSKRK